MRYLQLRELERVAAQHGFRLCPTCATLYEPCVVVHLLGEEGVAHIIPLVCGWFSPPYSVWWGYFEGMLCNRKKHIHHERVFWKSAELGDRKFWMFLLQRFPGLNYQPWTKPVLDRLGVDLEAEIAMWQLSQ
jgi:hypothetical protein